MNVCVDELRERCTGLRHRQPSLPEPRPAGLHRRSSFRQRNVSPKRRARQTHRSPTHLSRSGRTSSLFPVIDSRSVALAIGFASPDVCLSLSEFFIEPASACRSSRYTSLQPYGTASMPRPGVTISRCGKLRQPVPPCSAGRAPRGPPRETRQADSSRRSRTSRLSANALHGDKRPDDRLVVPRVSSNSSIGNSPRIDSPARLGDIPPRLGTGESGGPELDLTQLDCCSGRGGSPPSCQQLLVDRTGSHGRDLLAHDRPHEPH